MPNLTHDQQKWLAVAVEALAENAIVDLIKSLRDENILPVDMTVDTGLLSDTGFVAIADALEDVAKEVLTLAQEQSPVLKKAKTVFTKFSKVVLYNALAWEATEEIPNREEEDELWEQLVKLIGEQKADDMFEQWVSTLPEKEYEAIDNYPI